MDSKKVYKVLFKGVILPHFEKTQVIENIHNITKFPKSTIKRKFFSGKVVVIRRHADRLEYAQHLQKTFAEAGIETYIETYFEDDTPAVQEDLSDQIPLEQATIPPEANHFVSHIKIYSVLIAILCASIIYSLYSFQETLQEIIKKTAPQAIPEITKKTTPESALSPEKNLKPETALIQQSKPEPTPDPEAKKKKLQEKILASSPFLPSQEIHLLIKVSNTLELTRLSQFLPLFNLNEDYLEIIKAALSEDESAFIISPEQPLYVFKSKQHQGFLISLKHKLSETKNTYLEKQLDLISRHSASVSSCTENLAQKFYSTEHHVLLSSAQESSPIDHFKKLSKQQLLAEKLNNLNPLFSHPGDELSSTFNFYYSNQQKTKQLSLIAKNDTFFISTGLFTKQSSAKQASAKQAPFNNTVLLKELGIKPDQSNSLSSTKIKTLYDLSLVMITADQWEDFSKQTPSDTNFLPETITTIHKASAKKSLKLYQNDLDIDLQSQWESGPFALSTDNYKFNKQLVIELQAKGQNIKNLMEYSHAAVINVHSVLSQSSDKQKSKNIYDHQCNDKTHSQGYLVDHNGEQEAYVNDDFISYFSITGKKPIKIKPGYQIKDIAQIEGDIKLSLPGKISQHAEKIPLTENYIQFKNFALLLKPSKNKTRINYQVVDGKNSFLTIRAYNKAGEVLISTAFKKKDLLAKSAILYQQTFSEPVSSLKIFYTNKKETLSYPFSLKPQIIPNTTILLNEDKALVIYKETQSQAISPDINREIQIDNPAWMGKYVAEKTLQPFFLMLFLPNEKISDAILNLKINHSPFISQNMTAVKLSLMQNETILLDKFVSFSRREFIQETNSDKEAKIEYYLNADEAFNLQAEKIQNLKGSLILRLPTEVKTHSVPYQSPGQNIKLNQIMVTPIKINRQQVQFVIRGKIENLVQLKLYNEKNKLISQLLEFKQTQENKALITLLYNDNIKTIKIILAEKSSKKEYPFSFAD